MCSANQQPPLHAVLLKLYVTRAARSRLVWTATNADILKRPDSTPVHTTAIWAIDSSHQTPVCVGIRPSVEKKK
jgi:hypothetical protein